MCGIAGVIDPELSQDAAERSAVIMGETLIHRGPDGGRTWAADGIGLAHRRLSIIDIESGAQPMVSERGLVIVFNGEIYNYLELRAELEAKGHRFATQSDTEVLLALFEEEGETCLDRLVGMFAFTVWNPATRRLFLARDRVGKKPLFLSHDGRFLAFASEAKALLALEAVKCAARLDIRALSDFLSFGYVLNPKTFWSNIRQLPPGHAAWFEAESGAWRDWDYWKPERFYTGARIPFDRHAEEHFTHLLDDAVRIRLRSDVPLGAFLSGGLDSTAVVESMARQSTEPPLAFTVGFREASYDESPQAAAIAAHLKVPFQRLEQPEVTDFDLSRLAWFTDQPFADTSLLPTHALCKAARSRVTVALSGDGADELLAGYATHRANAAFSWFRHLPGPLRHGMHQAAQGLKPRYRKVGWDFKIRQFLAAHAHDRHGAHTVWRQYFPAGDKARLLAPALLDALGGYDPLAEMAAWFTRVPDAHFLDQCLFVDMKTWLPDDILVKADRMSMANSLEVRSPFLDHRLVEFCARLEPSAKMSGRVQKVLLRRHLAGRVPPQVLSGPKRGFNAPTLDLAQTRPPDRAALFHPGFHLDPKAEDITYKGFALAVLAAWLDGDLAALPA